MILLPADSRLPSRCGKATRRRFWASPICALIFGIVGSVHARQAPTPPVPSSAASPAKAAPTPDPAAILLDPAATRDARQQAAEVVVRAVVESPFTHDPRMQSLVRALELGESSPAALAVLARLAAEPHAPGSLLRPVIAWTAAAAWPAKAAGVRALSSFGSREGVAALVRELESAPPEQRGVVVEALARLSGQTIGDDPEAWRSWLDAVQAIPESQWQAEIARAQRRRADRAVEERVALLGRLRDTWSKLYLETPSAQRAPLITALLEDPLPAMRSLGLEYLERELGEVRRSDPRIEEALLGLVSSAEPEVRERAISLLGRVSGRDLSDVVFQSLSSEDNPRVAATLLRLAARWPSERLLAPAMKWIASDSPAGDAALDAAWAVARAGAMDEDSRARLLEIERATPISLLRPAGTLLLASFGTDADRDRLARTLEFTPGEFSAPSVREAAAQALIGYSEYVDAILAAAASDPTLFPLAARAVLTQRATADGYTQLASLPTLSADERRAELLGIARALPSEDLLAVVAVAPEDDLQWQESLLANFASENRRLSEQYAPAQMRALCNGVLLLADLRLELGKPDTALAAVESTKGIDQYADPARLARVRTIGLAWLNRVDAAAEQDAPPSVWLEALEASRELPHAAELASHVRARLYESFTPDERERFEALAADILALAAQRSDLGSVDGATTAETPVNPGSEPPSGAPSPETGPPAAPPPQGATTPDERPK